MQPPDWAPKGVDTDRVSTARAYDFLLGGSHNFAADREAARQGMRIMPDIVTQALANRAFLHRAVTYLAEAGVRQFIDIGSGIPTVGNVHEVAQRTAPDARVVYVDVDPVAVAHSRQILAGNDLATVIEQDLRRPEEILADPRLRALVDLDRPVAVLLLAILHAIPDEDDPHAVVARIRDALSAGSYLVIAHGSPDSRPDMWAKMVEMSRQQQVPITPRSRAEVTRFFTGFELVEPGVVWAPEWHPEEIVENPGAAGNLVGVGRLRSSP
jgi:SAM-dependent methyltransferase